jgi:hypothetical protein
MGHPHSKGGENKHAATAKVIAKAMPTLVEFHICNNYKLFNMLQV